MAKRCPGSRAMLPSMLCAHDSVTNSRPLPRRSRSTPSMV
jgi:hypothetical protein